MSRHQHLVEMDKLPKTVNLSNNCSKHQCLPFDYFCVYHDVICCKGCLPKNHSACKTITSIDIASKNSKQSQSFVDSQEQSRYILEALEKLINNRKENYSRLEEEEKNILKEIATIKENANSRFESSKDTLLKQLSELKGKYEAGIKRQEKDLGDLVTSTKGVKEELAFVKDNGSDQQAFVSIHSSKPVLDEMEYKVKQLIESFEDVCLVFVENISKGKNTDIGSIEMKETPLSFSFIPYKQRQAQVPVTGRRQITSFSHLYDIDMKKEKLGGVTGITISDNNTLIFCDLNTRKIYFCDEYDIYQSSTRSPYEPWDVAAIPGTNMAVISGRKNPYIQFLDIGRRMITKKVKLDQSGSGGIAVTKDNIYITIKHKIQVLDVNGKLKRIISLNQEQNINWYISVCPNGNICYSNENAVHCITSDGCPMFSYASSDIRYARNTITDDVGNIYVLDYYSRNIHKLSSTGTLVDNIFNDRLSGPLVFCFSKDLSKLYIANGFGTKISVFTTS
ncbi:Hypothetical predicted protein [Mytilus galloprovincialis]|uniref:B box-type domain-containing protein n=1 Tax=Mytilus galloprovincialis TaxID=29158 RepID=A0A8B6CE11_MYTGA|nr:Hypothetical predicted protein [Mytilus galloprovincialis]VDI03863.1 Hypothetical predicted protein [Mytilus galloprovincialis]VDI36275.1 Hypothetical predicted protein [Mytilus galloprovincialis]